jgi:hypothetical protein
VYHIESGIREVASGFQYAGMLDSGNDDTVAGATSQTPQGEVIRLRASTRENQSILVGTIRSAPQKFQDCISGGLQSTPRCATKCVLTRRIKVDIGDRSHCFGNARVEWRRCVVIQVDPVRNLHLTDNSRASCAGSVFF